MKTATEVQYVVSSIGERLAFRFSGGSEPIVVFFPGYASDMEAPKRSISIHGAGSVARLFYVSTTVVTVSRKERLPKAQLDNGRLMR